LSIKKELLIEKPRGTGRKDYSLNVEKSVQPVMRSHQFRSNWSAIFTLPTLAYPDAYGAPLGFEEGGVTVDYVPASAGRHYIQDIEVSGNRDDPTVTGIYVYSYPDYAFVEAVAQLYGQRTASIHFSKGHLMQVGRVYYALLSQYTLFADFTVCLTVHAIEERIAGD
jgi:hypothetical protein